MAIVNSAEKLGFALAQPIYGPIPFCKVSADVFGEEEVAVIYPACVRAARPVATMEIRALHSYQPIGLEGHWDEQVGEVPV